MSKLRMTLIAMTLLTSASIACAQTSQQDHDAHHTDPNVAAPAAPKGMSGSGGDLGMGMGNMMGGDMQKMMPMMMQMMHGGMMGAGMPDMGPPMVGGPRGAAVLQHIEGQIAFYKAELRITDPQTALWNSFADTLRAGAGKLQEAYKGMTQGDAVPPIPDQLARRHQILAVELETLQTMEPAARALYGALSAEQKKTADAMMADHLRRM